MKIRATLKPGVNGGEQLVCVHYRYDKSRNKRYKTVELIIEKKGRLPNTLIPAERRVCFRIGYGESELRSLVKRAGGYWNLHSKAWHLSLERCWSRVWKRVFLMKNSGAGLYIYPLCLCI